MHWRNQRIWTHSTGLRWPLYSFRFWVACLSSQLGQWHSPHDVIVVDAWTTGLVVAKHWWMRFPGYWNEDPGIALSLRNPGKVALNLKVWCRIPNSWFPHTFKYWGSETIWLQACSGSISPASSHDYYTSKWGEVKEAPVFPDVIEENNWAVTL